jgi:hypothetical protein
MLEHLEECILEAIPEKISLLSHDHQGFKIDPTFPVATSSNKCGSSSPEIRGDSALQG